MEYLTEVEYGFARMAVDKAKLSVSGDVVGNAQAKVAVVITRREQVLGWAIKGNGGAVMRESSPVPFSNEPKEHAEAALLRNLANVDLSEAVAYVTLEPCTLLSGRKSCAQLLIESGIRKIYVGNSDPHPNMSGSAWTLFFDEGIIVRDFPADLRDEARRDNLEFLRKFVYSPQAESAASFNYGLNDGCRTIGLEGKEFHTRWTECGDGSIYAVDHENDVCIAKGCRHFDHVDDPLRWFEDKHYTKMVKVGDIAIFRNNFGFALIKITQASRRDAGGNGRLAFKFQIRYLED